ncbi:hypothetical protein RB595_004145 [Gaeumannomyces hyphopodioides]
MYKYRALADPAVDIRLLDILPGNLDDEISLHILHAPLPKCRTLSSGKNNRHLTLAQLQDTVPPGWVVRITTEGRYIFNSEGDAQGKNWQWEHPDPTFDKTKYGLSTDPDLDDQSPGATPTEETSPPVPLKYEALSYTWNSGVGQNERIFIQRQSLLLAQDDKVHGRYKIIGQSLAVALRHLRRRDRPRRLWIDAICINQDDKNEKDHQVARMSEIFKSSHRVVSFLGPEADNSGLALRTLHHLGRQVEVLVPNMRIPAPGAAHPDWVERGVELPYDGATWDAITALMNRKWFTRLWIIQESRLAGRRAVIQAGPDAIPLSLFRRAVKCLRGKDRLPLPELRPKLQAAQQMTDDQAGLPFCAVLDMGYGRGCIDPRDRVYGLLGMAPPRLAAKIRPQYSKAVADVMRETALTHMRHCLRLELLKRCRQDGRAVGGLPSWVPDLTCGNTAFNMSRCSDFAAGHSRAHFWHRPPSAPPDATAAAAAPTEGSRDVLEVLGVRCAVVASVSAPLVPDAADPAEVIRSWQPADWRTAICPPTGTPLGLAHAATLRRGIFCERYPDFKCTDLRRWVQANSGAVGLMPEKAGGGGGGGGTTRAPPPDSAAHGRAIKLCMGKTYVRTREGHIGLAPADARPGDVVTVLLGCDSPVLLRPTKILATPETDTGSGSSSREQRQHCYYTVMGECFIHGLQDAAALLGPLPEPWRVELTAGHGNRLSVWFVNHGKTAATTTTADPVRTREDPRLMKVPLPGAWERLRGRRGSGEQDGDGEEADDPEMFDYFRNRDTGEVVNSDPRMMPEALEARGVSGLQRFALV